MGVCRATKANGEPCTLPTNSLDPGRIAGWYANAYTRLDGFAINQKEST